MPRAYTLAARALSAETTRRRILDAARDVLLRGDAPTLNVRDVAAEAGVARSTVYADFGSRTGLLIALGADVFGQAGLWRVREMLALPDAVDAMARTVELNCQMYASAAPVLRRLFLMAQLDAETARVFQAGQEGRAADMRHLGRRLAEEGRLRPDLSASQAAATLWVLTGFATFDQLFRDWGQDASQTALVLAGMAVRALVADPR